MLRRIEPQVVYFHNPQYERRKQERKNVDAVSKGTRGVEMVQLVPCYMQLHPDILVEHEDTSIFGPDSAARDKWAWLIMGRVVYLCSPQDGGEADSGRTIYYHPNAAALLHMYRKRVGITE